MPFTFPTHLFNPSAIKTPVRGGVISGGESLSGVEEVIHTGGGGVRLIQLSGIELRNPDQIRMWRAWVAHMADGATEVIVPIADGRQSPRPYAGGKLARPSPLVATSTDAYFPEATAFVRPFVIAAITGTAALRATTVEIEVSQGTPLKGGEFFSITHATMGRRLYEIERIVGRAGSLETARIRTPLREAVTAGTAADFDWPSLLCKLVPGQDLSLDIIQGRTASAPPILFRESI